MCFAGWPSTCTFFHSTECALMLRFGGIDSTTTEMCIDAVAQSAL